MFTLLLGPDQSAKTTYNCRRCTGGYRMLKICVEASKTGSASTAVNDHVLTRLRLPVRQHDKLTCTTLTWLFFRSNLTQRLKPQSRQRLNATGHGLVDSFCLRVHTSAEQAIVVSRQKSNSSISALTAAGIHAPQTGSIQCWHSTMYWRSKAGTQRKHVGQHVRIWVSTRSHYIGQYVSRWGNNWHASKTPTICP